MEKVKVDDSIPIGDKLQAYRDLVTEIKKLSLKLKKYKYGELLSLDGETYGQVSLRLAALRRRQTVTSKEVKQRYAEEKKIQRDWVSRDPL